MEAAVTTVPTGKPWRLLAFALAAFIILPLLPIHTQLVTPILETPLMLVAVLAVCALVGWLSEGKPALPLLWVVLAVWYFVAPLRSAGTAYDGMARGWSLLLAGSFGLVSLWSSATPFIVRALSAIGLAIGAAFILALSSPGGLDRYERVAASEFARRSNTIVATLRDLATKTPELEAVMDDGEAQIKAVPARSAILLPALIALESLATLALGWAFYSRLSPGRIGPPLSPLRQFRFNDQLIWAIAVGATLLLLPPFEEGRNAGLNLLVFFGVLYFIRGLGIMSWMNAGRRRILVGGYVSILVLALIAPTVGSIILAAVTQLTIIAAVVLGLGDTWIDWRGRPKPA